MKKLVLLILMLTAAVTTFADQTIRDGKGRKIRLSSNLTYNVVADGEIVRDGNGRKIILRDNRTWDYYSEVYISDILEDENGKKIWLKGNGTWGYMKKQEERDFRFRNVAIEDAGKKTRISGRVVNESGRDYESATFRLVVFDRKSYEYKKAGMVTVTDFRRGDIGEFEATLYMDSDDIASYYFEFSEGVERREKREEREERTIKKRPKAIFEFKMDIKN